MGVSTSWNPQGLPRPVVGLLYRVIKKSKYKNTEKYFKQFQSLTIIT
jgi:hypothetical protein